MPDTIREDRPNTHCSDCDVLGTAIRHWGPLVPDGEVGDFCPTCWTLRNSTYSQSKKVLPLGYRNEENVENRTSNQSTQLNIDQMEQGPLYCLGCEVQVTDDNDSGWCGFEIVDGIQRTRPLCKRCNKTQEGITKKAKIS